MRAGARSGWWLAAGKIVARMGFKGQHAARHAALLGLALEQRQHGLVAPVHAVKIADRQGAGRGHVGMVETAENLHWVVIFLIADCADRSSAGSQFVT